MAASRLDQYYLSFDPTFMNRVKQSLIAYCNAIQAEVAVQYHRERETYGAAVLNSADDFKARFAAAVATNADVIGAATSAGTVALDLSNVAQQAALVPDADIDVAIDKSYNSFFRTPMS